MKQTKLYLCYRLFQAQCDRCDQQNHQAELLSEKTSSIQQNMKLKMRASHFSFLFFFLVGEKGNTISTHRNVDCLFNKGVHQTQSVNQQLQHFDICFTEPFGGI